MKAILQKSSAGFYHAATFATLVGMTGCDKVSFVVRGGYSTREKESLPKGGFLSCIVF